MSEPLHAVSLFSGVGGLDLGLERAGIRIDAQCESDAYKRSVLRAHWRDTPIGEDVCTVSVREGAEGPQRGRLRTVGGDRPDGDADGARRGTPGIDGGDACPDSGRPRRIGGRDGTGHPPGGGRHVAVASTSGLELSRGVDLLTGGFPCQDLSVAGNRAGLAGPRSGLFHEFARIADALRPRWLLVENVPGLLSSHSGRDFGVVLATLADLGYGIAWRVLDARYFGVPQRRRRVFIVGHLGGDDGPALRALCESCSGNSPTLNCTWQTTRPAPSAGVGGVSPTLTAHHKRLDGQDEAMIVVNALDTQQGGADDNSAQAGAKGLSVSPEFSPGAGTGHGGQIGIARGPQVRRLTPVECERLMGWPDNWTAPEGVKAPDSRRYHACGDGVVANVAEWIGRRIVAEHNANRCARSEPHSPHVWVGHGLRGSWYDGREFPCPGVA